MRNFQKTALAVMAVTTLAAMSCSKNVFNEDDYNKIVKYLSPVDSVDQQHMWELSTQHTYTFTANATGGATQVQVYTENPLTSKAAQQIANTYISDGGTATLTVAMPATQAELCAALANADGTYTVKRFSPTATQVDFSNPDGKGQLANLRERQMAYTYLYETSCPVPDDYDYNDVVMRIAQERTGQKRISLKITMAAVGAEIQQGGAIQLVGYNYDDIDSVTTEGGKTFNDDVPTSSKYFFDGKTNLLMKGRNKEAVINLFQDAHWAIYPDESLKNGLFTRMFFNVTQMNMGTNVFVAPRTITYHIYFKDESRLNDFTLDSLDPFVLNSYNGGVLEIHTETYRDAQCMYNYSLPKIKDLPWALKVPSTTFRHPLEGSNIGFKKKGAMFGAYMTEGYSFGEWCEDHTRTLTWYLHPTLNQVF